MHSTRMHRILVDLGLVCSHHGCVNKPGSFSMYCLAHVPGTEPTRPEPTAVRLNRTRTFPVRVEGGSSR